ncbi:predicted protein [Nematostella vectensis]|uniref:MAM domain-containing protein n=1 Tax=Nematostella vectensis TaxID=45351 RepID=A7RVC8_NEMVE|nr:predicted protein [Nematostella vectensis]|eukprot:XP_001636613.1 predicted protein [Nematostella vectensis]
METQFRRHTHIRYWTIKRPYFRSRYGDALVLRILRNHFYQKVDEKGPPAFRDYPRSFVYAESSSPVRHGQTTRLISQAFQATSATCLSFFYHMYGDGIGGLEVYLVNSSRTMAIVWTRRGNHGNQWLQGLVDIKSSDTYQVMFEAIRGTSYYGDIALDDVTFRNGDCNCPLQKQQLRMRQPSHLMFVILERHPGPIALGIITRRILGRRPACIGITGGYTLVEVRVSAPGYYILLESSSPFTQGMTGRLVSKQYQASPAICLSFWYAMYGSTMGSLSVFVYNTAGRTRLWSRSGDQGQEWRKAEMSISSHLFFKIVFEGVRGSSYHSDIALDDVSVIYGGCG